MDELEFDATEFTGADTTTEIEGLDNHLELLGQDVPEQDYRTPAEQLEEVNAVPEQEQQSTVEGEAVVEGEAAVDAVPVSEEDLTRGERRARNRLAKFEVEHEGDLRVHREVLIAYGYDPKLIDSQNLDYAYIEKERTLWKQHQENGGDTNLENVANTFNEIRNDPQLLARYDRNGDGQFTISDWFDGSRLNLSKEEDLALTEKWLNDIRNPTLGTRVSSLIDRASNANMAHFTHQRRLGSLGPDDEQNGEQLRAQWRGGLLDTARTIMSAPEKVKAGFEQREEGQIFNVDAMAEHDALADDLLLPVSDPLSYGYAVNQPIKRYWSDKLAYEVGRYTPAIVVSAAVPGGLTAISKGGAPLLSGKALSSLTVTGARAVGVTWATETIPTNLFADFTHKGMGKMYDENTLLKKFADKHPETYVFGVQLSHWIDTPTGRLAANMVDEMGYDAIGLLGIAGILKGTPQALRWGLDHLRVPQKNMDQLSNIRPGHSHGTQPYTELASPRKALEARTQRLNDAAEAAADQQKMAQEGPASKWRKPGATEAELNTNYGDFKNDPTTVGQRKAPQRGDVWDITNQSDELNNQIGTSGGTVDEILTPLEKADFSQRGIPDPWMTNKAEAYWNDPRLKAQLDFTGKNTLGSYGDNTLRNTQEILGRDAASVDPKDFWGKLFDMKLEPGNWAKLDDVRKFVSKNMITQDALNQSLFKKLRDIADAGGEQIGKNDIFAMGGPMRRIADNLAIGLSNVKKTKFTWDLAAKKMQAQGGELTEDMVREIQEIIAAQGSAFDTEARDGVQFMMRMLENSDTDDLAEALLDVWKASDNIHNWKDFDAWMRQKISGGEFNGKVKTGVLIKELQGVMVNSILSGPKTPLRAIMGTTTNAYLNAINEAFGAIIRSPFTHDIASRKASLAKLKGMFELVPEAYQVFRKQLKSKFNSDIADIRTRYSAPTTRGDENWHLFGEWTERNGTAGDKAAFYIANIARKLNNNKLLSWSPRALAATDDTFKWLLARARSKEVGMRQALEVAGRDHVDFTPELMKQAEEIHYKNLLDADGNLDLSLDSYLNKQFKEVTLTSELQGFSKKLDNLFNDVPLIKPFYLFARTGINGLNLTYKNTPLLGALHKESIDILRHTGDDFTPLFKYGIENAEDLANARNLFAGRQAVGFATVSTMAGMYMGGQLTGNGPADRQLKQNWINAGWKPNHIYIGDVGFDYTTLEPYNTIFSSIADIGDNIELMGSEWAEKRLQAVAFVIGRGVTGKTYLSGLDQMMQIVQMKPGSMDKGVANILNNSIPLAGLRNEFGKWANPHMKELNSDMWTSIRNRNQATEFLAADPLPAKSDLLNGKPIKNWNIIGRSFNAISPIALDIRNDTPGRKLLLDSNYDLKSTTFAYGGYSFVKDAHVRAHFQNAIGTVPITIGFKKFKNVEEALGYLATRQDVKKSMAKMKADGSNPANWDLDPNTYPHNTLIDNVMNQARAKAWAKINQPDHPGYERVQALKSKEDGKDSKTRDNRQEILDLSFPERSIETLNK